MKKFFFVLLENIGCFEIMMDCNNDNIIILSLLLREKVGRDIKRKDSIKLYDSSMQDIYNFK